MNVQEERYDIDNWKLAVKSPMTGLYENVAQVLKFNKGLDQNRVLNTSLDGTIYIQAVGSSIPYAKIDIFSSTPEKDIINEAVADCERFRVVYRGKTYYGYINNAVEWSDVQSGYWYQASITFIIDEEAES